MRKALVVLGVLMAVSTPVIATDLTGQWSLQLRPDFSGHDDAVGCSFLQEKEKLTLNCGDGPNITGEVKGRNVTFHFVTGPNNDAVATYTGELDRRETTIAGTWRLTSNNQGPREGKFLATKISDK